MPFWRSYAHLIWGTKERKAFIVPPIERPLRAQIVSKAGELGCYVYAINGMPDHIHVVLTIPPKISAADVVKSLKGSWFWHFLWLLGIENENEAKLTEKGLAKPRQSICLNDSIAENRAE